MRFYEVIIASMKTLKVKGKFNTSLTAKKKKVKIKVKPIHFSSFIKNKRTKQNDPYNKSTQLFVNTKNIVFHIIIICSTKSNNCTLARSTRFLAIHSKLLQNQFKDEKKKQQQSSKASLRGLFYRIVGECMRELRCHY